MPTAIIVGAGTAGLCTHLTLRQAGFEVRHFERKDTVEERGGNLAVWSNGGRVLAELGLGPRLAEVGNAPAGFSTYDTAGKLVSRVEYAPVTERMGMPMYMIPRAHIQGMLLDVVGHDHLELGVACTGIEQDASGVTATLDDGRRVTADVLVGADGVWSTIRPQVTPEVSRRYVGITIWTGWMPDNGFLEEYSPNPRSMIEFWGPGRRLAILPSGRDHVGFTFIMRAVEDLVVEDPYGWLREKFADSHPVVEQIFERLKGEEIIRWPVYDLPPLERWSDGRVVLLGDAAHAASPTLGQGAGMAMEDAYVLAQCLSDTGTPIPERLVEFERRRRDRVEMISAESRVRSVATTEPDPERLTAIQDAIRGGTPWALLNGIVELVSGGPLH
ncbi:FAD-dependent monooxygenase [Streptomyces sp. NPDC051572]|uniref:FAD-dependent monooxygenase n=1 Tax=unclassified Streptomyces TaxID=2593676 RepID=UPI003450D122